MTHPEIKILSQDKESITLKIYVRDDDYDWRWVEVTLSKEIFKLI